MAFDFVIPNRCVRIQHNYMTEGCNWNKSDPFYWNQLPIICVVQRRPLASSQSDLQRNYGKLKTF